MVNGQLWRLEGIYQAAIHFGEKDRTGRQKEKGDQYIVGSYYAVLAKERANLVLVPQDVGF